MKFSFKQFQFDCERLLLTENGNIVPLNDKATKLLCLFLTDTEKVHSKDEIFAQVWSNKVVSEQVIFQNISLLRSLFGSNSIKTFVKKGYQWQLPITLFNQEEESKSRDTAIDDVHLPSVNISEIARVYKNKGVIERARSSLTFKVVFLMILILAMLSINHLVNSTNDGADKNSTNLLFDSIQLIEVENQRIKAKLVREKIATQSLFDSPYNSWKAHTINSTQWLVATRLYPIEENVALRFHIQGAKRGWSDYIMAPNEGLAYKQLDAMLSLLAKTQYFTIDSNSSALTELNDLIDRTPNDDLLIQQLIKFHIELNEPDIANSLVNQQLAKENSQLRTGLLYLLQYEITPLTRQWDVARKSTAQAMQIFQRLKLPQLESIALIRSAWVDLAEEKFRNGIQALNKAASKARSSKEPLLEVEAHLVQSFMASKAGQTELMYSQLGLAKELLLFHQLGDEHLIPVYRLLGWTEKSASEALLHDQTILSMPFSPQYEIDFYIAADRVRKALIEQKSWSEAHETIKPWQRQSFQSLARADIAFARDNLQQGHAHAYNAYQQAKANHHKKDALDASLLLLLKQSKEINDSNEFKIFIQQHATPRWLSQNSTALEKVNKGNK